MTWFFHRTGHGASSSWSGSRVSWWKAERKPPSYVTGVRKDWEWEDNHSNGSHCWHPSSNRSSGMQFGTSLQPNKTWRCKQLNISHFSWLCSFYFRTRFKQKASFDHSNPRFIYQVHIQNFCLILASCPVLIHVILMAIGVFWQHWTS